MTLSLTQLRATFNPLLFCADNLLTCYLWSLTGYCCTGYYERKPSDDLTKLFETLYPYQAETGAENKYSKKNQALISRGFFGNQKYNRKVGLLSNVVNTHDASGFTNKAVLAASDETNRCFAIPAGPCAPCCLALLGERMVRQARVLAVQTMQD